LASSNDVPSRYDQLIFGIWPLLLALAMKAAMPAAFGKPRYEAPFVTSVGSLAMAVRVSLVLSNCRPAPAPLMSTAPLATTVTLKVLPVPTGEIVVVAGRTLMVFVFPVSASVAAGRITEATRNMAPADSAASLDRFTWLSLSGFGWRCRT
jgi:hypothetical protein